MAECDSTGRELSFEWSHQRISSTDSKVSVILQNATKHSGSEWVNSLKDGHLFMAGLKSVRLRECRLCLRFCCPI